MLSRCVIVDDNCRFLRAATTNLEAGGLAVMATAATVGQAWDAVRAEQPDVVLIDITLGQASGVELCRELLAAFPRLAGRVVLISTRSADDVADLVEGSGAAGFLDKSALSAAAVRGLVLLG